MKELRDNIFLINRSELSNRLEAEYYKPSIFITEKAIKTKSSKKLSDFIVNLASGATPSITDEQKYYSDKENGVPFLRVQNLQPNGILNIEDVKYINMETHNNYLKRSQVSEYDLLVKITGVGRMAVASVAPKGFVGNTNQHMVVIKTESKEISDYLSFYLNLDIVERLASRRATGATRPALDYTALKSIPIIENIDFTKLRNAQLKKQKNESEANELQKAIDGYILKELGINIEHSHKDLKERIFLSSFSDVVGLRFDPAYFNNASDLKSKIFENNSLRKLANITKGQSITKDKITEGEFPVIAGGQSSPYSHNVYNYSGNIITVSASGAYSGFVWYHNNPIFASDCNVIQSKDESVVSTLFLYYVLKAQQNEIYKLQQGAGQPHVYARDLEKVNIPLPKPVKQTEMLNHIKSIEERIIKLRFEANENLELAKNEIEKLIIG